MCVRVEFSEEGNLAVVHSNWLTPHKKEVWWSPYRQQTAYYKALKKGDSPEEASWSVYGISHIFFEEGWFSCFYLNCEQCSFFCYRRI